MPGAVDVVGVSPGGWADAEDPRDAAGASGNAVLYVRSGPSAKIFASGVHRGAGVMVPGEDAYRWDGARNGRGIGWGGSGNRARNSVRGDLVSREHDVVSGDSA